MTVEAGVDLTPKGSQAQRLVRAEILKIRTTNTWWLFLIGMVVVTLLALVQNAAGFYFQMHPDAQNLKQGTQAYADAMAQSAYLHSHAGAQQINSGFLTSGQYFGVLFAMLLAALVVTNEYFHQTASATFMTSPHRSAVILAKVAAAASFSVLFWLLATVIDLIAAPIWMNSQHIEVLLTDHVVLRSVGLNLLGFFMWAAFGIGLGTLIRSQIGAVVTGAVSYLIGYIGVTIIFQLLYSAFHHSWVLASAVFFPMVAAQVMVNPGRLYPHAAPQWVGLLVMIGWAVVMGGVGIALTRKRDIA